MHKENSGKIKSQKQIVQISKKLKKDKKKIVALSGSFDILHSDHIESYKEAKSQGDILIILLNSDASVGSYKGANRPVNPQAERAKILSAIEYIDYVVIFDEIIPLKILAQLKPDVFCQGKEWGKNCIERKTVEDYGGKIYIFKHPILISTSKIIKRIVSSYSRPDTKAVFLDRDGTINKNEPEYVHKKEDFKVFAGTIPALKKLSKTDYKIIIITNQSGIARGYYTESQLKKFHTWMVEDFKRKGIRIDAIYYCPHAPDSGCACRKPKPGMLLEAGRNFKLNLSKSWFIGDDKKDVIAGREANVKTIKIGEKNTKRF